MKKENIKKLEAMFPQGYVLYALNAVIIYNPEEDKQLDKYHSLLMSSARK